MGEYTLKITSQLVELSEKQIYKEQKTVDYDTREFTIEIIVAKYEKDLDKEENEIYVPDYQREFVWDEERQSKFIESIILGLPIPLIFVAENKNGRLEIVDGSQRIRTLHSFLNNKLELLKLEVLDKLNGFKFENLSNGRQRKFKNTPMRMIVLSENATEEVKNDMFERINRGSDLLKEMEKRKGIYRGPFNDFIYNECAKNEKFIKLAPMNKWLQNRQEHQELILRFFCLSDYYPKYPEFSGIARMLDAYLDQKNKTFTDEEKNLKKAKFDRMVDFVSQSFEHGFCKTQTPQVSRVYFEAISVGVHLALDECPQLSVNKKIIKGIINSEEFKQSISEKYHTHKNKKILQRIDAIKTGLLGVNND